MKVKVFLLFGFFVLVSLFFAGLFFSNKASAISGARSNIFPDVNVPGQEDLWTMVQLADRAVLNKALTTQANVYVPITRSGETISLTIIGGCERRWKTVSGVLIDDWQNSGRDLNASAGNTFFVAGRGRDRLVNDEQKNSNDDCSGNQNDLSITLEADPAYSRGTTGGYLRFLIYAVASGDEDAAQYINAFRFRADTSGVLLGVSDILLACPSASYPRSCPSDNPDLPVNGFGHRRYTYSSFWGGRPTGQDLYDMDISIQPCANGDPFRGRIFIYDLDASDSGLKRDGQNLEISLYRDQNFNNVNDSGTRLTFPTALGPQPAITQDALESWTTGYSVLGVQIFPPHPGYGANEDQFLLLPPNNDPTFDGLANFDPAYEYTLRISGIGKNNAVQFFADIVDCPETTLNPVTCTITSPIRIRSDATSVAIPVRINAVAGSAVPAGTRVSGLHLGIAAAGTPSTWNATGAPNPPPDTQSRYVAKAAGSGGLSHYTEDIYNRYWVNNAVGEGSSGDVTISVDINDLSQDLVVRLLDRANGRWLANYCSVKINRNSIPTISINGTPGCTNFSGNYRDSDGDRVEVYLLVNGNRVVDGAGNNVAAFNLSDQTSSASDTPYSFNLSSWRDFNARNFQVAVSDGFETVYTANQPVGPCVRMNCEGITLPDRLEVNRSFSVTPQFRTKRNYGDTTQNLAIQSRGVPTTYSIYITITPSAGGPANPVASGALNATTTSGQISQEIQDYVAPDTATDLDVVYRLESPNSNANATCPDGASPEEIRVAQIPYIQAFRGDVIAGYGIKNNADNSFNCSPNSSLVRSNVDTALPPNNTEIVGSGTQTAVFARGAVSGFRSAITDTAAGINTTPWVRIFANTSADNTRTATTATGNGNYGGSFVSSLCAEDWFEEMSQVTVSTVASVDIAGERGVKGYSNGANPVIITASDVISGSRKIFVEGDVVISSSASYISPYPSALDIPSSIIVATGNIYIEENVTNLDGIYIARGTVFTCTPAGVLPTATGGGIDDQLTPAQALTGGCYSVPLTLNGAIIAESIRLWRTGGTLSKAIIGGSVVDARGTQAYTPGLTGSETFLLPPEAFLAPRFGEVPTNGGTSQKQLDSLISLPPPF